MSLNIGTLTGTLRADPSGWNRGLSDAELRMRGLQRDTEGRLRNLQGRFVTAGQLAGMGLSNGIINGTAPARRSIIDFAALFDRFKGLGAKVLPVAGAVAMIGVKAALALPAVAGLLATLANLAPAAGLAATGILAVVLAQTAFKIGMSGVKEAIAAAFDPSNPEAFAEALKKLSPNARSFVLAIKDMAPQFEALKRSVQDRLFREMDSTFKRTATTTMPIFKNALTNSAGALNLMGRRVLNTATGLGKSGALGTALSSANAGLYNMSNLPSTIVQGLVQIGAAAGPSFAKLTKAGGGALDRLSQKMAQAFASGRMEKAIEKAVGLFGDLWDTIKNVGDVIGNIFGPMQDAGAGLIPILKDVTAALADITGTEAARATFEALWQVIGKLSKAVSGVLGDALKAVMPLFQTIVDTLGGPLGDLFTSLGGAIGDLVGHLGKGLRPVVESVSKILAKLAPIVGKLVDQLGDALGPILETLGENIGAVADAFGSFLAPILERLPDLLGPILDIASKLLTAWGDIVTQIWTELQPSFATLGESFGEIIDAVTPLLDKFGVLISDVLEAMAPLIPPITKAVGELAELLAGKLALFIETVVIPALETVVALLSGDFDKAWQKAKETVKGATTFLIDIFNRLPGQIWEIMGRLRERLETAAGKAAIKLNEKFGQGVENARRKMSELPGKAASALAALGSRVAGRASSELSELVSSVSRRVRDAANWVGRLPGMAAGALGNLGGYLYDKGASLINGFINGIFSRFNSVRSTLSNLTSMLPDWKGPEALDRRLLTPAGRSLIEGFQRGIAMQTPSLQQQLQGLTAQLGTMAPQMAAAGGVGGRDGGPLVSISEFHAGGKSERQIAEELDWLSKGRG